MMSKADILIDFSDHQAMGYSSLEVVAAGCSVIIPKCGGNLRKRLQIVGIRDVAQFNPEKASYNILNTLFRS